ncbi:MAG: SdrD B-like domain-containing protein, partial [Phototrophicaceae bacterium]
ITLQLNTEPNADTDVGPEGTGAGGVTTNSNLTADFGLFRPLSIGNRVWFDTGAGTARNNGLQDSGEQGIPGVSVALYRDTTVDGVLTAADTVVGTPITTDSRGYYLFDNLLPGNYFVVVQEANLTTGVLVGYAPSTPTFADTADINNNGISPLLAGFGIRSNLVTLGYGTALLNETDLSGNGLLDGPNSRGSFGESDANSNLAVDFGFVADAMSVGNRVWLDNGVGTGGAANDGIQNGAEPGIGNVTVQLFAADTTGNPIGAAVASTTTTVDNTATSSVNEAGYYLFSNIPPGRYVVVIPSTNFQSGGALLGTISTTTPTATVADARDNGIDTPTPATVGVRSALITLTAGTAPALTEDGGTLGTGLDSNGNVIPDNNSNLIIDFGFVQRFDWGDAPESGTFPAPNNRTYAYGTTGAASGANHGIISTLYIGATVDDESNGQPNAAADGDDIATTDDEDGVTIPRFVANTPQDVQVQVYNNTGVGATLVGWVDFNGNGKFDAPEVDSNNNGVFDGTEVDINSNGEFDPPEGVSVTVPSSSSIQYPLLRFLVPNDADIATVGSTYARFRLSTDPTLTVSTPTGNAI